MCYQQYVKNIRADITFLFRAFRRYFFKFVRCRPQRVEDPGGNTWAVLIIDRYAVGGASQKAHGKTMCFLV